MNLIEAVQEEIKRNKELLTAYEAIPQGAFGAVFIKKDIDYAEKTIAEIDTVGMVHVLKSLRENN